VFADGRIELDGRPVRIENLKLALSVASVCRPCAIAHYSRENPWEVSRVDLEAFQCILALNLRFAFPAEATPTVVQFFQDRGSDWKRKQDNCSARLVGAGLRHAESRVFGFAASGFESAQDKPRPIERRRPHLGFIPLNDGSSPQKFYAHARIPQHRELCLTERTSWR
jgi:hypothetical protein